MGKTSFALLLGLLLFPAAFEGMAEAPAIMTPQAFLELVRNPRSADSWARLEGTAVHKRDDAQSIRAPIRMGILFTPGRVMARLLFNSSEIYEIGQSRTGARATTLQRKDKDSGGSRLSLFGINPDDLTMSFLYWKFVRENPPVSIRGQDCRSFLLEAPDGKNMVRALISREYLFPVRAEFFSVVNGRTEPDFYKYIECGSFAKENDLYIVKTVDLGGSSWRTRVKFEKTAAGLVAKGIPEDLFQ